MNREELIKRIKYCADSISKNAENIAANYEYMTSLTITCYPFNNERTPEIHIDAEFIPENFMVQYQN